MTASVKSRVTHLRSVVGAHGQVEFSPHSHRFVIRCRVCTDVDESNPKGTPRKRVIAKADRIREAAAAWLAHEATPEHELNAAR